MFSQWNKRRDCSSIIKVYENIYNNSTVTDKLNLKEFFLLQIQFQSNKATRFKHQIIETVLNSGDQELIDFVNTKMPSFYLNQVISYNDIKWNIEIEQKSFIEILELITAGLLIMSSKYEYLKEKVYFVNNINLNNFFRNKYTALNNVKLTKPLTE